MTFQICWEQGPGHALSQAGSSLLSWCPGGGAVKRWPDRSFPSQQPSRLLPIQSPRGLASLLGLCAVRGPCQGSRCQSRRGSPRRHPNWASTFKPAIHPPADRVRRDQRVPTGNAGVPVCQRLPSTGLFTPLCLQKGSAPHRGGADRQSCPGHRTPISRVPGACFESPLPISLSARPAGHADGGNGWGGAPLLMFSDRRDPQGKQGAGAELSECFQRRQSRGAGSRSSVSPVKPTSRQWGGAGMRRVGVLGHPAPGASEERPCRALWCQCPAPPVNLGSGLASGPVPAVPAAGCRLPHAGWRRVGEEQRGVGCQSGRASPPLAGAGQGDTQKTGETQRPSDSHSPGTGGWGRMQG